MSDPAMQLIGLQSVITTWLCREGVLQAQGLTHKGTHVDLGCTSTMQS
jgi:hypothetical protein